MTCAPCPGLCETGSLNFADQQPFPATLTRHLPRACLGKKGVSSAAPLCPPRAPPWPTADPCGWCTQASPARPVVSRRLRIPTFHLLGCFMFFSLRARTISTEVKNPFSEISAGLGVGGPHPPQAVCLKMCRAFIEPWRDLEPRLVALSRQAWDAVAPSSASRALAFKAAHPCGQTLGGARRAVVRRGGAQRDRQGLPKAWAPGLARRAQRQGQAGPDVRSTKSPCVPESFPGETEKCAAASLLPSLCWRDGPRGPAGLRSVQTERLTEEEGQSPTICCCNAGRVPRLSPACRPACVLGPGPRAPGKQV
uniref:uncharacterized protein LOC132672381 n=1 Tax=Panthera onca TaxID=9690 RepID=UPI002955D92E|nr:uncharacterized protein LOC132672381 [Panthera onca]XP_060480352.1 uncharacterized protein LOC132672381 [Panthera onca]